MYSKKKEGEYMKHTHKYETVSHKGITSEAMGIGIQAAEIRKCNKCNREMIFLQTRKGEWIPLFDERESEQKDILLA